MNQPSNFARWPLQLNQAFSQLIPGILSNTKVIVHPGIEKRDRYTRRMGMDLLIAVGGEVSYVLKFFRSF